MPNEFGPNVDVQGLMHEIRANIAKQNRAPEAPVSTNGHLKHDGHYHVNDLLRFHGEDFVRHAYHAVLGREPDAGGMAHYMEQLASGNFNKVDVLASMQASPEGRNSGVKLEGLSFPAAVRRLGRLPLIGYFVRVAVGIARLPRLAQHQNRFEFYTWSQQRNIVEHQDQQYSELRDSLQQISAQLLEMMQHAADQQQARELSSRQYQELIANYDKFKSAIETRLNEMQKQSDASTSQLNEQVAIQTQQLGNQQQLINELQQLIEKQIAATREDVKLMSAQQEKVDVSLLMQDRRLTVLLDQVTRNGGASLGEIAVNEQEHLSDEVYASFEDQFRGPREEIHRRLQVYLPYLKEAGITKGVLDIGCGRGEWLQLLRSEGIEARGIDRNRVFIEDCRGAGLDVLEEDALTYLRSLPDNELDAVSAFHFVEHVPFEMLIRIVDEIRRTLKPGGLLFLETPNPENLIVGGCNFHTDPTHRNPIPSETLKFIVESRGLHALEILKLRPRDEAKLAGDDELIKRFNEYFYSAPDYGIVARKP